MASLLVYEIVLLEFLGAREQRPEGCRCQHARHGLVSAGDSRGSLASASDSRAWFGFTKTRCRPKHRRPRRPLLSRTCPSLALPSPAAAACVPGEEMPETKVACWRWSGRCERRGHRSPTSRLPDAGAASLRGEKKQRLGRRGAAQHREGRSRR